MSVAEPALEHLASLSHHELRRITHALLREWTADITVNRGGSFFDFDVTTPVALGVQHKQCYRLYLTSPQRSDLEDFRREAAALLSSPVAIVPFGVATDV